MSTRSPGHAGIVLAAGASRRMGQPKALLPAPDGLPLAGSQVELLLRAGCTRAVVVIGHGHDAIQSQLARWDCVVHKDWRRGRLSSVQAGLTACPDCTGYVLLPVDTIGLHRTTVSAMLACADADRPFAVRPHFRGTPGRLLWLSPAAREEVLRCEPARDLRLDALLAERTQSLTVDDMAVTRNINTFEAWQQLQRAGAGDAGAS